MLDYEKLYHKLKNKAELVWIREGIVEKALTTNVAKASSEYNVGTKTIRKWIKRYQNGESFADKSRAPNYTPHKMDEVSEYQVIERAKYLKSHGKRVVAKYIKDYLNIDYSTKAVINALKRGRLWKTKTHKKKPIQRSFYRYKQQKYEPFEVIQVDVKYLTDIKEFQPERKKYQLSKYIYSARCIVGGYYFYAEANSKTMMNSMTFIHELFQHLLKHGIDLSKITIQTDNGAEFGLAQKRNKRKLTSLNNEFIRTIESYQAKHRAIPVGAKTWQSDVETVHRIIEDEHYASEVFLSKKDYFSKTKKYLERFNTQRINHHRAYSLANY